MHLEDAGILRKSLFRIPSPKSATIKIDGQERGLILGEDFEIVEGSYINNVNKGTAKETIHGLEGGRYALGGYKTVTFKIGTRSISEWWKGIFSNL